MRQLPGTAVITAPRSTKKAGLGILVVVSMAISAAAQNVKVYVGNSSNSRIAQVQFNPPSTTIVIDDANRLTQVRDIAIRDDGLSGINLIVADRNGGQVVFYRNSAGSGQVIFNRSVPGPERPDGISLNLTGDLFVMNSGQGSSAGVSQVWVAKRDEGCPDPFRPECTGGGYRTPLGLLDDDVQFSSVVNGGAVLLDAYALPESLVIASNSGIFGAGDLLVLTNPAGLVRYPAVDVAAFLAALASGSTPAELTPETIIHPGNASVPEGQRFPAGVEPNGLALTPHGDLLIAVSDGRILIYGSDGQRASNGAGGYVDFTAGTGQDELKLAVALQDGRYRAYVTHQQRGELRRYTVNADGTGTQDAVLRDFQSPVGVDATTSNTVPAPAGQNVDVAPTTILSSRIEQVLLAGQVNARVSTFADPREQEVSIPPGQPLHRPLQLSELRADLPSLEIPSYARAFPLGDPDSGTPTFILIEADSSATFRGLLDHHAIESTILGYDPDCLDPEITRQPFMFWSPDENDPPIVEGDVFIDVTSGCGSIRGITRNMSYFLVGVRITAPMAAIAAAKLDGLSRVITGSVCVERRTKRRIELLMTRVQRDFSRNDFVGVADVLQQIDDTVEGTPQAFSGCVVNIGGEIQARCRSARYTLSKLP